MNLKPSTGYAPFISSAAVHEVKKNRMRKLLTYMSAVTAD